MKLPERKQEAVLAHLDMAMRTLKDARNEVYSGSVWDTAVVQTAVGLVLQDLSRAVALLGHPGEASRIEKDGAALAFEEAAHFSPNRGEPDEDAAQELYLYLTNTGELFGPGSMGSLIERNLARKWKKGTFDAKLAQKAYSYLTAESAKRYVKEHGSPRDTWHEMFNVSTRRLVDRQLAQDFVDEAELGNFRS